jgi:hypothetical protein
MFFYPQTAEPLGEIVVASMDAFEDEDDDYYIALDEPPSSAQLKSLLRAPAGVVTFVDEHNLLLLPVSAHQSWLSAQLAVGQVTLKFRERLALLIVRSVFALITETVVDLAELRIDQPEQACTAVQGLALRVVALLANSEFKPLLNAYFYRVLIAKASLRAEISARIFLKR